MRCRVVALATACVTLRPNDAACLVMLTTQGAQGLFHGGCGPGAIANRWQGGAPHIRTGSRSTLASIERLNWARGGRGVHSGIEELKSAQLTSRNVGFSRHDPDFSPSLGAMRIVFRM